MKRTLLLCLSSFVMAGCSHGGTAMTNKINQVCGDKPNCVSTLDQREKFHIAPYPLKANVTINQIEQAALKLSGAKTAVSDDNYLRIECTSTIMRFVDDLELQIKDGQLIVRSESRVGYSDFGVNRKRAEQLRNYLNEAGLLGVE
ncbi:hypothetical protein VII00023_04023 [Vibrio ichthyoenteri ATCC 700023]|uniref:Lipoprotein n=1 Tax=Vibrio ichthyoenteri ATCC 700023 TaxID=870968 RepID=F9S085_9VIBR|nr:DUF1499 domain-containing protein [Vibrio ichthyoenteri]EGU43575.1 hypothetical protein VII00023_04023 [Vibrio ichthyoenteri ATCC 700023]